MRTGYVGHKILRHEPGQKFFEMPKLSHNTPLLFWLRRGETLLGGEGAGWARGLGAWMYCIGMM